jgi:hypothetical protein
MENSYFKRFYNNSRKNRNVNSLIDKLSGKSGIKRFENKLIKNKKIYNKFFNIS